MAAGWAAIDLLPAAVVLAAAVALTLALRRWFDPVPRSTLVCWAAVMAVLFTPFLVGGKVLLPLGRLTGSVPYSHLPPPEPATVGLQADLVLQILPWQARVRHAVTAGRWPLWNDLAGAGMPLQGDPQAQAFQPLVLASYLVPLRHAPAVTAALRVLLALAGSYLLLRRQGLASATATFGSLACGTSGAVLLWLGWPLATSLALLPLALYGLSRCDQVGGRRDHALLGGAAFALLLGGHPETVLYAFAAVAALWLALALARRRQRRPVAPFVRGTATALLLAGALAAPVLVPVQAFLPQTERSATIAFVHAPRALAELWREQWQPERLQQWRAQAERNLVPFAAARALGDHEHGYWGQRNYIEDGSAFAGTVALALALAGCGRAARRFPQERLAQLLAGAGLLLVAQPPAFANLVGRLPIVGATAAHENHRLVGFVALAIVCLAACEVERWRLGERRWWQLGAGAAAAAALVAWGYLGHRRPGAGGELFHLEARWLWIQLAVLAAAVSVMTIVRSAGGGGGHGPRALPWIVALLAVVELLALHGPLVRGGPARLFYPGSPPVDFLARNLGGQRFAGLWSAMQPNYAQVHGLADVRIDGPSRPAAYARVLSVLRPPGPLPMPQLYWVRKPKHPLNDLLGVQYVLTGAGTRVDLPLVVRDPAGWVYARGTALPRLFLPAAAEPRGAWNWDGWLARNPDFAARALVREIPPRPGERAPRAGAGGSAAGSGRPWRARRPRASRLAVTLPEPERLSAVARLAERRLLASSVWDDGGWRLLLDGQPLPTVAANGPFVAAWLPKGGTRVELLYRPRGFLVACLLAGAAAAATTCGLTRRPRLR